jgi:hypothetical protein
VIHNVENFLQINQQKRPIAQSKLFFIFYFYFLKTINNRSSLEKFKNQITNRARVKIGSRMKESKATCFWQNELSALFSLNL